MNKHYSYTNLFQFNSDLRAKITEKIKEILAKYNSDSSIINMFLNDDFNLSIILQKNGTKLTIGFKFQQILKLL